MLALLRTRYLLNKLGPSLLPNYKILVTRKVKFSDNPLDVNTNVLKDVILFKYDNPRFFKIINIFAGCQFIFWSYLSVFSYSNLRDAPVEKSADATWWRKINLGENKYRNTLSIVSFIIGYGILAVSWMYTVRSVRYLILRKGGQDMSIVTYTPFGTNRILTTNLKNINCKESRTAARSQLPLKVKGRFLHYIVDMKGEFKNVALFDSTAGLRRMWKHNR